MSFNIDLQKFVYSNPSRINLLDYVVKSQNKIKISVYRNHSFELVEHTIAAYLDFAGFQAEFLYSDYDDSLSFFNLDLNTDMLILWLDLQRYSSSNLNQFITDRLSYLEKIYSKPVLLSFLGNLEVKTNFLKFDMQHIADELGEQFFDIAKEPFTGTRISSKGLLKISFELGMNYIPSIVRSPIKALVLDLDNTLYKGVIGEDGVFGIEITSGHVALQTFIKSLKDKGVLLAVASKNDESDVIKLFKNPQMILQKEDFNIIKASWNSKYQSIAEIAKSFNIGLESILFVDDNYGELYEADVSLPNVKKLLASSDAMITKDQLENFPRIRRFAVSFEDKIRSDDIKANQMRNQMQTELSQKDYIKSLGMRLIFWVNKKDACERISELANKTNQFIFNYKRYSLQTIQQLMSSENCNVVSVELKDNLSDSGIICVCVGIKEKDCIVIDECFVSCRALGRGIDEFIVNGAISLLSELFESNSIKILFQKGEKNEPAVKYVQKHLSEFVNQKNVWTWENLENIIEIKINK